MAGVDPNAGMDAAEQTVPSIGGEGTGQVMEERNLNNDHRNDGVEYNENPGVDVDGIGSGFPAGTDVGEANNPLKP